MSRNEEATFNNVLAAQLRPILLGSINAEQLGVLVEGGKPDILIVDRDENPVVVETEFMPAQTVDKDARSRLGCTLRSTGRTIEAVISLSAPRELRNVKQANLPQEILESDYKYSVFFADEASKHTRVPEYGMLNGDVYSLADTIEICLTSEQRIKRAQEILEGGISIAANLMCIDSEAARTAREKHSKVLCQEDCLQTSRMAMAIISNALVFHLLIAGERNVPNFDQIRESSGHVLKHDIIHAWNHIMKNINYVPIFDIAIKLLIPINDQMAAEILGNLAKSAQDLVATGVSKSHDLSGRVFQRLISDRKFLATYYTLPTSALFLSELAVRQNKGTSAIETQRIADLACGTGTLLSAAYQSVMSRFRRGGGDDSTLHKSMLENSLVAADIMPAAVHLTTSMLSSAHPAITFEDSSIHLMPYGKQIRQINTAIGSLELLDNDIGYDLFGSGTKVIKGNKTASEDEETVKSNTFSLAHNSIDFVIMNPPFTRPTNHSIANVPIPSFAGFGNSTEEQRLMSEKLKLLMRKMQNPAGSGNAGLASYFLDLAHSKLKENGKLAMVMPLSLVSGESWRESRALLARNYTDIVLVTIADQNTNESSFSADTSMDEVLVVATKKSEERLTENDVPACFVTLFSRPQSRVEAVELARNISHALENQHQRHGTIKLGNVTRGNMIFSKLAHGGCASVTDAELGNFMLSLQSGKLSFPGMFNSIDIPLSEIGKIGMRGLIHRDINGKDIMTGQFRGPFDIEAILFNEQVTFPVLWAHNASKEKCMIVAPDKKATIRRGMEEKAKIVWSRATRLHFNLDFRFTSQSLTACATPNISIGGRAWPNFLLDDITHEKAALLWANSTLGLMLFWWTGTRQHAGRALISISRLPSMLFLDTRHLSATQLKIADSLFSEFSKRHFLPAYQAYEDPTRIELDKAVFVDMLGMSSDILESLDLIRRKWCAEPTVHACARNRIKN